MYLPFTVILLTESSNSDAWKLAAEDQIRMVSMLRAEKKQRQSQVTVRAMESANGERSRAAAPSEAIEATYLDMIVSTCVTDPDREVVQVVARALVNKRCTAKPTNSVGISPKSEFLCFQSKRAELS